MANEITVSSSLVMANGNFEASMRASGVKIDQSALAAAAGIVSVTTNVTTLSLGIVTSAGYASFRNLNTATAGTAYIAIGSYVGTNLHEFAKLGRSDVSTLRLNPTITIGYKTYTAVGYATAVSMQYLVTSE
jgi:hypothetical protein